MATYFSGGNFVPTNGPLIGTPWTMDLPYVCWNVFPVFLPRVYDVSITYPLRSKRARLRWDAPAAWRSGAAVALADTAVTAKAAAARSAAALSRIRLPECMLSLFLVGGKTAF